MGLAGAAEVDVLNATPVHTAERLDSCKAPRAVLTEHRAEDGAIVRSASFTALIGVSKSASHEGIKRTFSDNVLSSPAQQPTRISPSMQSANVELFRRASRKTKKRMSIVGIGRDTENDQNENPSKQGVDGEEQSKSMVRSVSGTIKSFARRSWMPSTRTESPSRKNEVPLQKNRSRSPQKRGKYASTTIALPEPVASRVPARSSPPLQDSDTSEPAPPSVPTPTQHKSRSLKDIHIRNQSVTEINRLSRQSSRTSLGSGGSADGMYLDIPSSKIPPIPNSTSSEQLSGVSVEINRKKDPLWNAFRSIEGEWGNFQSKTSLQKAKVIRTVLLPFLVKYANDPSNLSLRAEDLDRRVVILSKWWSGLLELLSGRSNQSISGTDRPAFLEAIIEIMLRHEWRVPSFQSRPSAPSSKWTNSVESDETDFLLESIHQNVRNIFVQNLLSQMALVVDKLSMRSAPASLVIFSGKTCAYAFFFCPGVADILVRLWHIPAGILRRIFSEYGGLHSQSTNINATDLSNLFPPPVRSLVHSSQSSLARYIQPKAIRPAGSESIRWYGPWVNRWVGRDSDLFFVFAKHYHLLVCQFYPSALSQQDRLLIPGLAPVHAQMLIILESTLYRHVGHFGHDTYAASDSADAMVPLPMSIPNATRSIAENRLVMLLRDVIADTDVAHANVCALLVESFEFIMKAATKKVSMYNSEASFVLCDLVEEIFPIFARYEFLHSPTEVLDWSFWMNVFQLMVQSETCMTQIRVIALLYSIWPVLMSDERRKRSLILDWILKPSSFNQLFNHWSPMVRHYYYRLLCWRVSRCDGEASELDLEIFQAFATLLNDAWARHQYLIAEAEMRTMCPPSSNPCSPAPGRTLIIVRTDDQPASPSPFTSFDKLLSRDHVSPYASHSNTLNSISEADLSPGNGKKRWSILKSFNPFGSSQGTGRPGEVTPPGSPANSLNKRGGNSAANSAAPSRPGTPPHQALCFKFFLEYVNNKPQVPGKEKKIPPPKLPANAQKLLDRLSTSEKKSSESVAVAEIHPRKPKPHELNGARYSGRALAEWAQVVSECRNFYARRKQEGCPKDSLIETPTMAVEVFRMFG